MSGIAGTRARITGMGRTRGCVNDVRTGIARTAAG